MSTQTCAIANIIIIPVISIGILTVLLKGIVLNLYKSKLFPSGEATKLPLLLAEALTAIIFLSGIGLFFRPPVAALELVLFAVVYLLALHFLNTGIYKDAGLSFKAALKEGRNLMLSSVSILVFSFFLPIFIYLLYIRTGILNLFFLFECS